METQDLEFKNILVVHFGQLGDVVLGLPALRAIRRRFPDSKITVLSGKSTLNIIRLARVADEQIAVDRVELRDGNKLRSIGKVFALARQIRQRHFDLVVDLHSLYETNLLGYFSGARYRLYANRENRSLDRLSSFPIKPPLEDRSKHASERYLDVIRSLGIDPPRPVLEIAPDEQNVENVRELLAGVGITDEPLVGMFLGAGHPSRRWDLKKYAELATRLTDNDGLKVLVFLGPEEIELLDEVKTAFPPSTIILDKLGLLPLFAVLTFLRVLVSNDTGPTHLAATTQASIVLIVNKNAPTEFLPLTDRLTVVRSGEIDEIGVDEVYSAVRKAIVSR